MSKKKIREDGIVYSTNPNFEFSNANAEMETLPPENQNLRIWIEKGGRAGKIASVIKGYIGSENDLKELAGMLKNKLGTGGNSKDGEIIIQGDHREKIVEILLSKGYKAKKAGGN